MNIKERAQLEALSIYLLRAGQKETARMLEPCKLLDRDYHRARAGVFQEIHYLLHSFLEGQLELPN